MRLEKPSQTMESDCSQHCRAQNKHLFPKKREDWKGSSSPEIKLFNLINHQLKVWPKIFHFVDRGDKNNSFFSVHVFSPVSAVANFLPFSPTNPLERPPENTRLELGLPCLISTWMTGTSTANPEVKFPRFQILFPLKTPPDSGKVEHLK